MYFLQWMKFVAAESEFRRGPKADWQPTREMAERLHNGFFRASIAGAACGRQLFESE
jgi:hypothetical protein